VLGSPWPDGGGGRAAVAGILHSGITKMQWSMTDMGFGEEWLGAGNIIHEVVNDGCQPLCLQ
jgi:hypothetical protein